MLLRFAVAALVFCRLSSAQDAFEVATVKPTDPSEQQVKWNVYPGGRLQVTNFTLKQLVETAYGMSPYCVTAAESWIDSDYFSIAAKAPEGSATELLAMLRTLLSDRFALKLHRETRQLPVYILAVAKGGSKLAPARNPSEPQSSQGRFSDMEARSWDLVRLIDVLETFVHRKIIDRTGLTGKYDFTLKFDPRQADPAAPVDASADTTLASLATALQTQLGLTLTAAKGPVEVMVIDGAKKPSAN